MKKYRGLSNNYYGIDLIRFYEEERHGGNVSRCLQFNIRRHTMKKIRLVLFGLFLFLLGGAVLAQSKLPGLIHSGQYHKETLGSITQPEQTQYSYDAIYNVGEYPLSTPELPSGKGREIIQIYCRFCHSTTYITMQPPPSRCHMEN